MTEPDPNCRACGKPFTPTHDADAPGPTARHVFVPVRVGDPTGLPPERADPPVYATTLGCALGHPERERCGAPVYGAYAVHTLALPLHEHLHEPPTPSALLLCQPHFGGLAAVDPARSGG